MKKWVFTIVLIGMLTWTVYDFVIKQDDDTDEAVESLAKKNQNEKRSSFLKKSSNLKKVHQI